LSLNAAATYDEPVTLVRYIDVVLVVVAAPLLLLTGVPAVGYGVGAGAWIVLRAVGVAVEQRATARHDAAQELTVRLVYAIGRVFLLALAIILVKRGASKDDALAALLVILIAFTVQLVIGIVTRPKSPRSS
jgi:hypothetical protein